MNCVHILFSTFIKSQVPILHSMIVLGFKFATKYYRKTNILHFIEMNLNVVNGNAYNLTNFSLWMISVTKRRDDLLTNGLIVYLMW